MKGKKQFTKAQIDQISTLIEQKLKVGRAETQKGTLIHEVMTESNSAAFFLCLS